MGKKGKKKGKARQGRAPTIALPLSHPCFSFLLSSFFLQRLRAARLGLLAYSFVQLDWFACLFAFFSQSTLINENIRADEVRLLGAEKEQLGVVSREQALAAAEAQELDLVMVSADASPPVCRIMDYSKFRYDITKKQREQKKIANATRIDLKEIKMRYNIDKHDYEVSKAGGEERRIGIMLCTEDF